MSLHKFVAALLSCGAILTAGGAAQAQIFSNSSGYNSSNTHAYPSGAQRTSSGRYSESVLGQAAQLNQSLAAAQQAVVDAEYRASGKNNVITRYTRQPNTGKDASGENCPPDPNALAELEQARANLAQANAAASSFLQSVRNPTGDQVVNAAAGTAGCLTCYKGW